MASGNSETKPPLHGLTEGDRGPIILIAAYCWIFITAIVTTIRFGLAWSQRQQFKVDDGTFAIGAMFAIASSVCFHISVNEGLGKHMDKVPLAHLDTFHKAMYAGDLLSIAAMAAAKTSVIVLSDRVAPRQPRPFNMMLGLIGIWSVFSIFAIGFQCGLPDPWMISPQSCSTKGNLWYPVIILNILTDGVLALWILPTLWRLLLNTGKRVTVMCLFGSRLIVCCFAIVQLSSVARHNQDPDVSYATFGRIFWGVCITHLSVLLAAVPRTNRFIVALQSTHMTTLLTDFELAHPSSQRQPVSPKDASFATTEAPTTVPDEAHIRRRSESDPLPRSHSHSPSRSHRSQQPLVDAPLRLTPSAEQGFSAQVVSSQSSSEGKKQKRGSNKYNGSDWRKYVGRRRDKNEDMNLSSMFSWGSRTSIGQEQIMRTREVTQEVEVVPPAQSRWVLSKPKMVTRDRK